MSRKTTTLLILTVAFLLLIGMQLLGARLIILASYLDIERGAMTDHLQRGVNAINYRIETLVSTTGDYAIWDETYRYAASGDPGYIAENLNPPSLARLDVNFVAVVRNDGRIMYAHAFDIATARPLPLPVEFSGVLPLHHPLLEKVTPSTPLRGIFLLQGEPLLVVSRPILPSNGKGPGQGFLIMGRFLDAMEMHRLGDLTQLSLAIIPWKEFRPTKKQTLPTLADPIRFDRSNSERIKGYHLLGDLKDNPILLLKIDRPRTVYQQGLTTIRYMIGWSIFLALLTLYICNRILIRLQSSQARHEEAEALNRALLEHAVEAVVVLDAVTCRILRATPALAVLLRYRQNLLPGVLFSELLPGDERHRFQQYREQAQQHGELAWSDLRLQRNDGSEALVEISGSISRIAEKTVLCLVIHDISGHKELEAEIARLKAFLPKPE